MRTLFLILIALTVAGGTVIAAQNDIPGEPLYGLKLWSEEAMLRVARVPEWQLYLSERWASRRLMEVTTLIAKKKPEEAKDDLKRAAEVIAATLEKTRGALETVAKRGTARAILAAFLMETRVAVFRRELTILQNEIDNDDLRASLTPILDKLDEINALAASSFEDLERKAKPQIIEASARALIEQVSREQKSVEAHYERLKNRGANFSDEVAPSLAHAGRKLKEAQDHLKIGQYRAAFATIREAFRIFQTFGFKFDLVEIRKKFAPTEAQPVPSQPSEAAPQASPEVPNITLPPPDANGVIEVPLDDGRNLRIRTEPVQ